MFLSMKARELDARFDAGEDLTSQLDPSKAGGPGYAPRRVNIDSPAWMVIGLDREARRLGVPRQALIKL